MRLEEHKTNYEFITVHPKAKLFHKIRKSNLNFFASPLPYSYNIEFALQLIHVFIWESRLHLFEFIVKLIYQHLLLWSNFRYVVCLIFEQIRSCERSEPHLMMICDDFLCVFQIEFKRFMNANNFLFFE